MSGSSRSESAVDGPAWERDPALRFEPGGAAFDVLDQTALPFAVRRIRVASLGECVRVIRDMQVRGAPLIGVTAAAGMALATRSDPREPALTEAARVLIASRPTAVNLAWAVRRVLARVLASAEEGRAALALAEAMALQREEHACCERIGGHGLGLLRAAAESEAARRRGRLDVLTHCNAGWLATGAWGTALAPLYRAHMEGIPLHVWVDETRPRNQGARLTAWELARAGIAHTIVVDNAAAHLMQRGMVDLCLVGSDRTTAAGDVCNKIGTYAKALAAADNAVPFYVALPCSTIDWSLGDGVAQIEIEMRDCGEVLLLEGEGPDGEPASVRLAAQGSSAANFAFDVTPARLVSALVCEHGVFGADRESLARLRAVAGLAPERV